MKNKKALIIGGANGIGLSITQNLLNKGYKKIYVIDKFHLDKKYKNKKIFEIQKNLVNAKDLSFIQEILEEVNTLIITIGVGRLTHFENIKTEEVEITMNINALVPMKILKMAYNKIRSDDDFYTMILTSIAGLISSPLYALYSASKAALLKYIEAINYELITTGFKNRITDIAPGKIENTNFSSGKTDLEYLFPITNIMIEKMYSREILYIPNYEISYKKVLEDYHNDPYSFSKNSYKYKLNRNLEDEPKFKVGYLSGTFDMFHIGHLNLIKRAKQYCDYLIVGVHKDGSHKNVKVAIPLNERMEILRTNIYVDEVILSEKEDSDIYFNYKKYDYLFVGSDYKGTERFNRYEDIFKPLGVEIIYFPYTKGVSSTQLRKIK